MAKSKAPAAKAAAKDNGAAANAAAPNGDTNGGDKPIRNLYLVDGSGYLFRAYHALPPMGWPPAGVPRTTHSEIALLSSTIQCRISSQRMSGIWA
jgi:DNA polymerase-1